MVMFTSTARPGGIIGAVDVCVMKVLRELGGKMFLPDGSVLEADAATGQFTHFLVDDAGSSIRTSGTTFFYPKDLPADALVGIEAKEVRFSDGKTVSLFEHGRAEIRKIATLEVIVGALGDNITVDPGDERDLNRGDRYVVLSTFGGFEIISVNGVDTLFGKFVRND